MRLLQRAAAAVMLLVSAAGIQVVQGGPAQAALPTAAVALGDSFVSGEGAGDYQPVVDASGTAQAFPGWSAPNSNAYFCHRSANASVFTASLPGIQQRFNLACSGARPADIATPASARAEGMPSDAVVCSGQSAGTPATSDRSTSRMKKPTSSAPIRCSRSRSRR